MGVVKPNTPCRASPQGVGKSHSLSSFNLEAKLNSVYKKVLDRHQNQSVAVVSGRTSVNTGNAL